MTLLAKIWQFIVHLFELLFELVKYFLGIKKLSQPCCHCPVPIKKPDPFLYSQFWQMKMGYPVTWDNQDIFIYDGFTPVNAQDLKASTTYAISANIWNNSTDVPVPNLIVEFSYLSFGIATKSHFIGTTTTDLGVIGWGTPAPAWMNWITPAALGHYCIQVLLKPPDDKNWLNNLGQRNMHVTQAQSPAVFTFAVGNHVSPRPRAVRFTMDSYSMPPLPVCSEVPPNRTRISSVSKVAPPVPEGWTVVLTPSELLLDMGQEQQVQAEITPPEGFIGSMPINVTGWDVTGPIGGVTLVVEVPL
jgi:hypothetical protein